MRILETSEIDQVSGAGLLGLNLNLGILDILGVHAGVSVGGNDRGHSGPSNDRGHDRRDNCGRNSRRGRC